MTRRAFLYLLGAALVVSWAATDGMRRVLRRTRDGARRAVEVGGPGGPVVNVVPLDEAKIREPSSHAG